MKSLPFSATLSAAIFCAGFTGTAALAEKPDVDCSMCHDAAPVSADHMPLDEVSVETCGMCHEASGDDPYFRTIHDTHGEALGCDTCHDDASQERETKLKEILGQ